MYRSKSLRTIGHQPPKSFRFRDIICAKHRRRSSMTSPTLRFREFELEPAQFELRRAGHRLRLERKPLELLILLVENRGNLVKREEIIQRVWGGDVYFDAERGINNAIRKIRAALHDESGQPQFVETIVGKGYRFIAPVNPESTIAVVA